MRKSLLSLLLVLALLAGCAPASGPPAETGSAPQAAASSQPEPEPARSPQQPI